jgi:hypothetical protein
MDKLDKTTQEILKQVIDGRYPDRDKAPAKSGYDYPILPTLSDRSFMILTGHAGVSCVWIDDEGSCIGTGIHEKEDGGWIRPSLWHSYKTLWGDREYLTVLRCPSSLSAHERSLVEHDTPEGHWRSRLHQASHTRTQNKPGRRKMNPEDDNT